MLENISYVHCLTVDFSQAFDTVNHTVLLHKISALDLTDSIHNRTVSFLIGHEQKCAINGICFSVLHIIRGITQGSGVGVTLYILMKRHTVYHKYNE